MEEINIQSHGIKLTEQMRKHIMQRLNSVFGFDKTKVQKIVIKLFEHDQNNNDAEITCHIKIYIKNKPVITTKLKSLDVFTAITLAIERTKLKHDHQLNDQHKMNKRTLLNQKSLAYGSYRIYQ